VKVSTSAISRPRISCRSCGVECEQTRPWSRYCSPGCRRRDHEKRKGQTPSDAAVAVKEPQRSSSVEPQAIYEVPKFTTPDGRPLFRLLPCPDCGGRQFAWPIGSDSFACAACAPPSPAVAIAAFLIAPWPNEGSQPSRRA